MAGGEVAEAGAHTGCACGFEAGGVGFTAGLTRRDQIGELVGALDEAEREELEASGRSIAGLVDAVRRALPTGPVRLYGCWYGDEGEPPRETRRVSLDHFENELEPFPDRVVFEVRPDPP